MSSVCTVTAPGTACSRRCASVVLPLELRPSSATIAGRPIGAPTALTKNSANCVRRSTRHGPAAGSPSPKTIVTADIVAREDPAARGFIQPVIHTRNRRFGSQRDPKPPLLTMQPSGAAWSLP